MVAVLEQERQTNLQEMSNLLAALGRAMVVRGPEATAGGKAGATAAMSEEDNYMAINSELIAPLMKVAVRWGSWAALTWDGRGCSKVKMGVIDSKLASCCSS